MSSRSSSGTWKVRVNSKIRLAAPRCADGLAVATMFGLQTGTMQTLYERFKLTIRPGQIVAVVGPSGAGKSLLLRALARAHAQARTLRLNRIARRRLPAVAVLRGGSLKNRLEILSRCGLADAPALVTPAANLSGGQMYRLALAEALHRARRTRKPSLVIADEFAATLDDRTADVLCLQMRKLVRPDSRLAVVVATPRPAMLESLRPDITVVKPLGEPARVIHAPAPGQAKAAPRRRQLPIGPGTIRDYHLLSHFHYLAGPPAAHKRVYVIRTRRPRRIDGGESAAVNLDPPVAAVLVVSPPVLNVRGRNVATAGRYAGGDPLARGRLNREVECISRVVVHPAYRGCGLAVRLVRHALRHRRTRHVEALAAMGAVHPFFELSGMTAYRLEPAEHLARLLERAVRKFGGPRRRRGAALAAAIRRLNRQGNDPKSEGRRARGEERNGKRRRTKRRRAKRPTRPSAKENKP